jgi:hypothetical protein
LEPSASKPVENLYKTSEAWATKVAFYMLWLEYLALSPSYELARRFRAGTITDGELAELPSDFDRVLAVFEDLGDVQRVLFRPWWLETGIRFFGQQGNRPTVRRVATLTLGSKRTKAASQRLEGYMSGAWADQGKQTTMIAAIPVGMPKAKVLRAVAALLDKYTDEERHLHMEPKYRLLGKRQNGKALLAYIRVIHFRSAMWKQELWRVGVRSKISFSYSGSVDEKSKVQYGGPGSYERIMLSIMTSRALLRGKLIAENAARGIFPSYASLPEAKDFEFESNKLYKKIASRNKWKTAEEKRLAEVAATGSNSTA